MPPPTPDVPGLASFENETGEGVVSFEPWQTSGPKYDKDKATWYCHLTIAGERVFEYGCPCGTCGIVFRKVGLPAHRVSDREAVELLGNLDAIPSGTALRRLARVLQPGRYHPMVIEGSVQLIEPGTSRDYFDTDVVRLFGPTLPEFEEPSVPETPYYRFGCDHVLERTGRLSGEYQAIVTAVVMPLHDPSQLNRERVEFWKQQHNAGVSLTALAVSVIDDQAPALSLGDDTYEYEEQFLFTNCVLDGHHRIQAAAELEAPVRILSLLTREFSLVNDADIPAVLGGYARSPILEIADQDQAASASGPSPAGFTIQTAPEINSGDSGILNLLSLVPRILFVFLLILIGLPLICLARNAAKIMLKAQRRILSRAEVREKLKMGKGTFIEEVDHYWIVRIWWTEDELPECSLDPDDPVNRRIRKEYLGIFGGKAFLTDLLPSSGMSPTQLWEEFPTVRVRKVGCWA